MFDVDGIVFVCFGVAVRAVLSMLVFVVVLIFVVNDDVTVCNTGVSIYGVDDTMLTGSCCLCRCCLSLLMMSVSLFSQLRVVLIDVLVLLMYMMLFMMLPMVLLPLLLPVLFLLLLLVLMLLLLSLFLICYVVVYTIRYIYRFCC